MTAEDWKTYSNARREKLHATGSILGAVTPGEETAGEQDKGVVISKIAKG